MAEKLPSPWAGTCFLFTSQVKSGGLEHYTNFLDYLIPFCYSEWFPKKKGHDRIPFDLGTYYQKTKWLWPRLIMPKTYPLWHLNRTQKEQNFSSLRRSMALQTNFRESNINTNQCYQHNYVFKISLSNILHFFSPCWLGELNWLQDKLGRKRLEGAPFAWFFFGFFFLLIFGF